MTTDISTAPYFDDFDETKNFHEILFKPGVAVQARELTQLQSILKDQIAKFGKHIFKQGSVVIPGNVNSDLNVPFAKLSSTFAGNPINVSLFDGQIIEGVSNGVQALVKHIEPAVSTDPHTLYLVYTRGSGATGINTFVDGEEIFVVNQLGVRANLVVSASIGNGSLAHISSGVFFVNGSFVYVADQTTAIGKYTTTPSCHVMLQITETIIDSDMDESLLDPANGEPNYNAPGADRLKIDLTLVKINFNDPNYAALLASADFVELMRFNVGVMEENNRYAQYNELEKTMARRTFDESGDYRVSGFELTLRDHLKTLYNAGLTETGDAAKFVCDFLSGKAYINGYEVDKLFDSRLVLDKGRTADHVKSKKVSIQNTYGNYLYVSDIVRLPNFYTHEIINLYDISGGTLLGTARVLSIDYFDGTPTAPGAVYRLYIHSLGLTGGYSLADIGYYAGSVTTAATGKVLQRLTAPNASKDFSVGEVVQTAAAARTATVKYYARASSDLYVYRHSVTPTPQTSEIITGLVSTAVVTIKFIEKASVVGGLPVFAVPGNAIRSVKTAGGLYDATYSVIKSFTLTTDVSGNGSTVTTGGLLQSPEAGNTTITGPSGVVSVNLASVTGGNTFVLSGAGASTTYYVTTQQTKTIGTPKSKSLQTVTLTGVAPAYTISLGKCDAFKITSIVDVAGKEWKDQFILNSGQNDYFYDVGSILFNGTTLPSTNLTIVFKYFTHSGGDYFTADSYSSMEVVGGSYDYLPMIPTYRSNTTNLDYPLRNFMDFRPRIGESTSWTDTAVPGSVTSTSIQYYVPRIDSIYLNTSKVIDAVRGEPNDVPVAKAVPDGSLKLFSLYIPAYTSSIDDIIVRKEKNQRYTMKDISKLDDRIANVEYFSSLNASEQSLLTYEVPDAVTGLSRFKTGYLVDNFSNPFTVCDYYNPLSGTQFRSLELSPSMEIHDSALIVDAGSSSNYQITGGQITMPFTEVPFISQKTSTRVTNINHFLLISWEGRLTLVPPIDNWIDTEYLPQIYNVVNNTVTVTRTETINIFDPAPAEPPQQPAPAPQTVNISLPNSLAWQGQGGQTTFAVPVSAVQMIAPGIYELSPQITENVARDWVVNQYNAGLTHPRVAGENTGHLLLDN
jgi:hypothetical protein